MNNIDIRSLSKIITNGIFVITLIVVLLSLVPVFFPALIARLESGYPSTINPYELGPWAIPILVVNMILLSITILYYGKMFPEKITRSIRFIFNFETSRKITFLIILILISAYIGLNVGKVFVPLKDWPDYIGTYKTVEQFDASQFFKTIPAPVIHYGLLKISLETLGNIKIIPFVESVSLLLLTYFITKEITQKRFAGIISMVILMQSNLFLRYDTDYAYTNAWALFYILSLYLIQKKQWHLSIISYVLSILSKALSILFLPMTFFLIYKSDISRKMRIINTIGYALLFTLSIMVTRTGYSKISLHLDQFWIGFTALENFLHFDGLILIFLLPLVTGLFVMSRRGILHANSMMVLITG
ncbi:MAG: hypothetical protein KGH95_08005, partial [Thaumarchaeota archaeon]|nr:hypothetical protein [Nitrososphaerota archaeon]